MLPFRPLLAVLLLARGQAQTAGPTMLSAGSNVIQVVANGGKITTYKTIITDPYKVAVQLDGVREVDTKGSPVGTLGTNTSGGKHFAQTLAGQAFNLTSATKVQVGSATAQYVSARARVGTAGLVKLEAYLLALPGMVGPMASMWTGIPGDVMLAVTLSNWSWCGCASAPNSTNGTTVQKGSFVDVELYFKGNKSVPVPSLDGTSMWNLGSILVDLPRRIQVDGLDVMMPTGYPKLVNKGTYYDFVLRVPIFQTSATYTAFLEMSSSATANTKDSKATFVSRAGGGPFERGAALTALALLSGVLAAARALQRC